MNLLVLSRAVCLPMLVRLWQPKSATAKVAHAVDLVRLLAAALPERGIHVVANAVYHEPACKTLPSTVSWTGRLHRNAVRYQSHPVHIAVIDCLWYGMFGPQPVQVILVRERATTDGYDLALVSTDLLTPAEGIITRDASRW